MNMVLHDFPTCHSLSLLAYSDKMSIMHQQKKRIAVIGAGIAGLTCAYELQKAGFDVVVLEKNSYVGGRMSSRVKDGVIFDLGADHLCDLYDEMKKYCQEFGITWEKMRFLKYGLSRGGQVIPIAQAVNRLSQFRLAVQYFFTKDVGDFFDLNDLADRDKERLQWDRRPAMDKHSVGGLPGNRTTLLQFHRASEISLGALLGIMNSIKKNASRWYLQRTKGGMQALPDAFARHLNVQLNHHIDKLVCDSNQCLVDDKSFDAVVLASTARASLSIYQNPTDKQKKLLGSTQYASTISVAFRIDRNLLPDYAIVWVPYVESEKISGFVNESMKGEEVMRDGESLLCVWLHEDFAKSIMDKSDDEIFAQVKKELLKVCHWFASEKQIHNHDLQRWPVAMPKFSQGHLRLVRDFMENGQGEQNVFLCGDYLNAPWTEGALRNGQKVARQITEKLAA